MKKKEFLTEAKRKAIIADKEKVIIESFAKMFNRIKRIDENEINEEIDPLAYVSSKISEVVRENDGPNAKSLTLKFKDGSEMYLFQNLRLGKRYHIPSEYDGHRYEAYGLYRLLANIVYNYWDVYKHFDNMAIDDDSEESLNELEFDIPRKPVTDNDFARVVERDRLKQDIDYHIHVKKDLRELELSNSEQHPRFDEFGDGNLVVETNSGALSPEEENLLVKIARNRGFNIESFIDGLYLIFIGNYYGDRFQGSL